jgi:TM2 domain-containing membrane protein YozV
MVCPYCKEEIKDGAVLCRFCNSDLSKPQAQANQTPLTAKEPATSGDNTKKRRLFGDSQPEKVKPAETKPKNIPEINGATYPPRSGITMLLLCFFLGLAGIHRFYAGKVGSGVAMLLISLTGLGVIITLPWAIVDFITILKHGFTDRLGRTIIV